MAVGSSAETVSMKGSASLAEQQQQEAPAPAAAARPFVCVECGRPVALLFREYNKGNIRLGRCSYCLSVADKYIEWEFVLIAIDLALHRVQAYRHLLFNMRPFSTHSFRGRLWQLGVGMAALDAHLRHTALSSEAAAAAAAQESAGSVIVAGDGGGDPFWEAGGLLLAAVVEHACFAAGAVLFATSRVRTAAAAARARRNRNRQTGRRSTRSTGTINGGRQEENWDEFGGGGRTTADRRDDDEWRRSGDVGGTGGLGEGQQQRRQDRAGEEDGEDGEDGYESSSSYSLPPPRPDSSSTVPSIAPSSATAAAPPLCVGGGGGGGSSRAAKMYMAVVYPLFFRLLAAFVMIWDRQVAILNTIELLVATMQFVALSAVVGGPAAVSGMGEGGVAAMSVLAGLASKMVARAVLCLWFGSDPRTLRML
ncbi:unnamed protein product [Ectocarpus sp. 4 AP-2014]